MMKKNRLYGMLLAAAALTMTSCTADESVGDGQGQVPIKLTTTQEGIVTRAATDVLSTAQFGTGETFYAYFPTGVKVGNATSACGTAFTTDGSGGTTAATVPYFNGATSATAYAYYPYVTGKQVTNATTSFSVELDQTSDESYKKSDLMYATATIQKASPTGVLAFSHKMAKIIVNATATSGVSQIQDVRIVGGNSTVALSNDGTCTLGVTSSALSTSSYIVMYTGGTASTAQCAALIPPQTVNGTFLQVVTDAGIATYSVSNKTFATSQSYTYNITVTATSIGFASDITAWDNSEDAINLVTNGIGTLSTPPQPVEAVDLGLSVLWANMNVGATSVTDYGLYFMWGDVVGFSGVTTDGFNFAWANYKWGTSSTQTKYCSADNKSTLDAADDAATANWGSGWRMPTKAEFDELRNLTKEWVADYNNTGVAGYKFTGSNGNSIFLPAAGRRSGTSLGDRGSNGFYWSSFADDWLYEGLNTAKYLQISQWGGVRDRESERYYGFSVRPVQSN